MATLCAVPRTSGIRFCHFRHSDLAPHKKNQFVLLHIFLNPVLLGAGFALHRLIVNHPDPCTASNSVKEGGGASLKPILNWANICLQT